MSLRQAHPVTLLNEILSRAIVDVLGKEHEGADPVIRPSKSPEFGDFQVNAAMSLGKKIGTPPRELAEKLVEAADLQAIAENVDVAGPGFINIRLREEVLADSLGGMSGADLGVSPVDDPHPVVVDLCGVNVAKQMHVGHLRSTIIGDSLARILERQGRSVLRENHLGDWGLPIAMVLQTLRDEGVDLEQINLDQLDEAYRAAQVGSRGDDRGIAIVEERRIGPHRVAELEEQNAGAETKRTVAAETLVLLQQGDDELVRDWKHLIDCTMRAVYESLDLLNVEMDESNNRGESFYREHLPEVVEAFTKNNLAVEDEGALVVRFQDRDRPMLIRKSNGGFLYATTDLAAIRNRVVNEDADRLIYVVDARQRDHFKDVFEAAGLAGWGKTADGHDVEMRHIPFGSVLGPDKKPLKTRSGENVTLASLLEEAVERGRSEVLRRSEDERSPTHGMSSDALASIGRSVGIGAVKYADLSSDLVRDYVFDMDRMIAFEGNTGPYLQYAHARICSIMDKAGIEEGGFGSAELLLSEPAERLLALQLLRYGDVVASASTNLEPHRICTFLYELSEIFNGFYQQCPVRKADSEALLVSRLRLCDLARRVLSDGLGLLGIDSPATM
ncbi:MAG: arginine--tRNA ligase [Planctomycetota bacterium]|nr:arginine--tRNA ligase [Planctomycetota bacterium]